MSRMTTALIALAGLLGALGTAQANVLWDIQSNGDNGQGANTVVADFVDAGVTEDLTGTTLEIIMANNLVDSNGVALSFATNPSSYGSANPANNMLKDYLYTRDVDTNTVTISGLSTQLDASSQYSLYLWGIGDSPGQNGTFVFNGESITTSPDAPGSSPADVHGARFTFVTDAVVADTLEITWIRGDTRWTAINGLAIVKDVSATIFPPATLTATGGDKKVDLEWATAETALTYTLYRSDDAGATYVSIASGLGTTTYTDTAVAVNTLYQYVVTSVSGPAESVYSPAATARPFDGSDTEAPASPSLLTGLIANSVTVVLQWEDNPEDDLAGYNVFRALSADGVYSNIGTTVGSQFDDVVPSAEESYEYTVTAVDFTGNESDVAPLVVADMGSRYIIEAEDHEDLGGQDIRTEATGDIGGGINIGYIDAGEFTTYLVDLPVAGEYKIDLRIARSPAGDTSIDVSLGTNGVSLVNVIVPNTGGWQNWQTVSGTFTVTEAGPQKTLRLTYNSGLNVNWFELTSPATGAEFTEIALEGDQLILGWKSSAYKLYTVEETADLMAEPVVWTEVTGLVDVPGAAGSMMVTTTVVTAEGVDYRVLASDMPAQTVFETDFESGTNGWSVGVDDAFIETQWELGTPSSGPLAANSPANCWGTNLTGAYGNNADIWLRSPIIDLSAAETATLKYWQYKDIEVFETFPDGAIVNVLNSAGTLLAELTKQDGSTASWEEQEFRLPAAAVGQPIILEFRFFSDNFGYGAGWYVDDVSITVP